MTEYSRMAKGSFISSGGAKMINLPFLPDSIEMWNFTAAGTPANNGVPYAYWDAAMGQGFATAQYFNATPVLSTGNITANGFSTFTAGQMLQFGPTLVVSGATAANPIVITTSTSHGYASGDVVILEGLFETTTTGMPQINGIPFSVTVLSATTFSIPWNGAQSQYAAITGASTGTPRVKKVLYPFLYFPGATIISAITAPNGTTIPTGTIQVDTASAHNMVIGQEVAFRIPQLWGSVEFNSLPNVPVPGSPIYGFVVGVTDYNTVIVKIGASASFTAFNSNPTVAQSVGLSWAQIVAVGDVNTGGVQISTPSPLYPSPYSVLTGDGNTLVNGVYVNRVNTINGPGINGAFVNNTSQGFIIGSGSLTGLSSTVLVGASTNVIYWRAYLCDMTLP